MILVHLVVDLRFPIILLVLYTYLQNDLRIEHLLSLIVVLFMLFGNMKISKTVVALSSAIAAVICYCCSSDI